MEAVQILDCSREGLPGVWEPAVIGRAAASLVRVRWRRGPVSAVSASPAAKGSLVLLDPVRALQHALYRAANADPGRRFHALYVHWPRREGARLGHALALIQRPFCPLRARRRLSSGADVLTWSARQASSRPRPR
jgi:hypothetical protein